jgi:hypothetical protein
LAGVLSAIVFGRIHVLVPGVRTIDGTATTSTRNYWPVLLDGWLSSSIEALPMYSHGAADRCEQLVRSLLSL